MAVSYYIAVDGGGTKTDFALIDEEGRLLARERRGPSNYQNVGPEKCVALLRDGIAALLGSRALRASDVTAACLGLAGLDTDQDALAYDEILDRVFDEPVAHIRKENDCFVALHSGTLGGAGIGLIAGTGSMAIACNERGERARSGGWGHRFGDEGSGFFIGREAIVRSLMARDGRGPATDLARRIEEATGTRLFDLVTQYNTQYPGPDKIAALAPVVDAAARDGDAVARAILVEAASELAAAVRAIMARLDFEGRPPRVVLCGGAFHSDLLRTLVEAELRRLAPGIECFRPELPPVAGAYVLALEAAGRSVTPQIVARLRAAFASDPYNSES